jgi:hypothetical protein
LGFVFRVSDLQEILEDSFDPERREVLRQRLAPNYVQGFGFASAPVSETKALWESACWEAHIHAQSVLQRKPVSFAGNL